MQGSASSVKIISSLCFTAERKDVFYLNQVGSELREGDEQRSWQGGFWDLGVGMGWHLADMELQGAIWAKDCSDPS